MCSYWLQPLDCHWHCSDESLLHGQCTGQDFNDKCESVKKYSFFDEWGDILWRTSLHCGCVDVLGREATDGGSIIQYKGPMGDPQDFTQAYAQDWPWSVWGGVWRPVEQHNASRYQDTQTRYVWGYFFIGCLSCLTFLASAFQMALATKATRVVNSLNLPPKVLRYWMTETNIFSSAATD